MILKEGKSTNFNYGNLNPGTYEQKFDASVFASGVYFYKLKAGNFVTSNKMILAK